MSLLIPTHALPPLGYRVPERLSGRLRVGSAVVAPLSGYSRLGFVVGMQETGERATEHVRAVVGELSLQPEIIELCRRTAEAAAVPLAAALRAALPPGTRTSHYRIVRPGLQWRWREGSLVAGSALRRALGREGMQRAEKDGQVMFSPSPPPRERVEWAVATGVEPPARAYRQRELLEELCRRKSGCSVSELLRATGATRDTFRRLLRRGAVRVEERAGPPPIYSARGAPARDTGFSQDAGKAVQSGGRAWVWRVPGSEQARAVASLVRGCVGGGRQALVLVPEVSGVERMVRNLLWSLPPGCKVAPYHSGPGADRAAVHQAARRGTVGVVVGTRAAALVPMRRPGLICVADEPNEAHRARPGYEGIPLHAREMALERCRVEEVPAVFLSSAPSLRLYARKGALGELPPREADGRPAVRVVDMRGSGAVLSSTLLDFCRENLEGGLRTGVISGRLGYATVVSCGRCGAVRTCPACDLPLAFHKRVGSLVCNRCDRRERPGESCASCGADRLLPTGLAIERVREEIGAALGCEVGLLTADHGERKDAAVVVGTAHHILAREWDALVVPDVDARLFGSRVGATEEAFRLVYRSVEAASGRLLVQTRVPDHYVLQAALRHDYRSFAAAELKRRRALGYPPYSHVAMLTLEGSGEQTRRAVESKLRPVLEPGVVMSGPLPSTDGPAAWRVLLRGRRLSQVSGAAARAARTLARSPDSRSLKVRVVVDPEEV